MTSIQNARALHETNNQNLAQYITLCNQDPLGITKAKPKQNFDKQGQTEFIDVSSTQESERMVLRRTFTAELGSGQAGEGVRGRRVRLYSATLSLEPR
jgi:hypothetical protein